MRYKVDVANKVVVTSGKWPSTKNGAWRESTRKWKWLVQRLEKNEMGARPCSSSDSCALCYLYFENDCVGCPVSEKSGALLCHQTPYDDYCNALSGKSALKSARREVKFLESLVK